MRVGDGLIAVLRRTVFGPPRYTSLKAATGRYDAMITVFDAIIAFHPTEPSCRDSSSIACKTVSSSFHLAGCEAYRGEAMSEATTRATLTLEHTVMGEAEALEFLSGHRIMRGGRTMDPKAQIVGEFAKSIRVPGYIPPLPELRQQLRTMVQLMDEPAPSLARIENITIPGPAGAIPGRIYDAVAVNAPARLVVAYFHGGGWVQGDLETHHGLCARLALVVYHEYQGQIHAFVSLTKAIPQGMDCTWEISDYLKERLHA